MNFDGIKVINMTSNLKLHSVSNIALYVLIKWYTFKTNLTIFGTKLAKFM